MSFLDVAREIVTSAPIEDVRAFTTASMLVIYPRTAQAVAWFDQNAHWPADQRARGMLACEHRYGPDLLMGAYQSGLSVTLDGRAADAAR